MKGKRIEPDEHFSFGPMDVSRFGRFVRMRTNWTDEGHTRFLEKLREMAPAVEAEITAEIRNVASIITRCNPLELLVRAYWEMAYHHMNLISESRADQDSIASLHLLEFIHNVVASTRRSPDWDENVSEADWTAIRDGFKKFFGKINRQFMMCESARIRSEEVSESFARFRLQSLGHWINVRGERHSVHEKRHLEDLLICHSEQIQAALGVSAEFLIEEIMEIHRSLTLGIVKSLEEMHEIYDRVTLERSGGDSESRREGEVEEALSEEIHGALSNLGLEDRAAALRENIFGTGLFELQNITKLPVSALNLLSWEEGEESRFFAEGRFPGWPVRTPPLARRPFLKVGAHHYCFCIYGLFDHIYRVIQRSVIAGNTTAGDEWRKVQKENSERLPLKYFDDLLPGKIQFRDVYYKWFPKQGHGKKEWCETDGLVVFGDHLFVIEVKAGAFSQSSPVENFDAFVSSLRSLVEVPARQGRRFVEYLQSSQGVLLFDSSKKEVGRLSASDFRRITVCVVTIDPFTEIAAKIEHLDSIGIDIGSTPTWAISLDDLRGISEIFTNPLVFLHFVEQRMKASQSKEIQLDDEFDHVGLYFAVNDYSLHAAELKRDLAPNIKFAGYRKSIDEFFHERQFNPNHPSPFAQEIPVMMQMILNYCLEKASEPMVSLSSFLLDASAEGREQIAEGISRALQQQSVRKKIQVPSLAGEVRLTIACWQPHLFAPDRDLVKRHARAELFAHGEEDRFVLELFFNRSSEIIQIEWKRIFRSEIPSYEHSLYASEADNLRRRRVRQALQSSRRIGRNVKCPCGSGKKYKHCCDNQ